MTVEEQIQLIAKAIAWANGAPVDEIEAVAQWTDYQDNAQQCFEDITGASA